MLRIACLGLTAVVLIAGAAASLAGDDPTQIAEDSLGQVSIAEAIESGDKGHEDVDPKQLHIEPGLQPRSPRMVIQRGGFVTTQVNVDANGMNIVGDAGNEPSIGVDPTAPNRMAIGWRQFDSILSNFREAGYSFSVDGGRSWAEKQEIESLTFRSDPVLEVSPDGVFYYMSLGIEPFPNGPFFNDMFLSTDGGATWPGKVFAFGGDKAWYAIDTTGGPANGNIYQSWNTAGNEFFPAQFNRSTDSGLTWSQPVPISQMPRFGTQAVGPDGELYVCGIDGLSRFWVVRSDDADTTDAATFSQSSLVDMGGTMLIGLGVNPAGLLGQAEIEVDISDGPRHGFVYMLCSVTVPGNDVIDIAFVRSEDGGITWSDPVRINDDSLSMHAWQWFGTMSIAPNGRLDVVWLDTRNDPTPNSPDTSQLFTSSSNDGGVTWTTNQAVTGSFSHFVGYPQQNKLGDYFDMRSDLLGADLAWAATFNGEQDVYHTRLGAYDCDADGVSDTDQIALNVDLDCNDNGLLDSCEIAANVEVDVNFNGIPDSCDPACEADINNDGVVDTADLGALVGIFGGAGPFGDINNDGVVDTADLGVLIAEFGTICPEA